MKAFKAYDVRGVWKVEFDEDTVYKIGYFIPSLLKADKVLVGRDMRLSSPVIHDQLVKGILDSGASVIDIGLSTTPLVYFSNVHYQVKASLMITASHNGKEYNGLKISGENAFPIGYETGLKELERLVGNGKVEKKPRGEVIDKRSEARSEYIRYLSQFIPSLDGFKIAIDASNGMASTILKDIYGTTGRYYINDEPDGSFPVHDPNPLVRKNLDGLIELVKKTGSDVGMIFDGDADRVVFVDEKGNPVQPDYMTAILSLYYKRRNMTGKVVVDIRTSNSTINALRENGFTPVLWKVGHAYATEKIIKENAIFGGELAGHYYLAHEFFSADGAIISSLLVMTVLKESGKSLSELISSIVRYSNSGEVNFQVGNKDEVISHLLEEYGKGADRIYDFDGYRIEYPTWWFNVRKSNTEPLLRIVVEAESESEMEKHLEDIKSIINNFGSDKA